MGKENIPTPQTGDFNGKVIDNMTQEPVIGATVYIGGNRASTDNDGTFSISVLPPGDYELRIDQGWYTSGSFHIQHVGKKDIWNFGIESLPLSGKILYSGDKEGNWDIYELDLANRKATHLTNLTWRETNPVRLASGEVIFQSDRSGNDDFFSTGDIHNRLSCCSFDCNDEHPSVALNGIMIFKTGQKDSNGKETKLIRLYNLNKQQQIVDIMEGGIYITGYNPVINADGTKVTFVSGDYKRLMIYTVSGSTVTKMREFNFYETLNMKINHPGWRPNLNANPDEFITFEAYSDSDGPRSIYQINCNAPSASNLQQLTFCQRANEQHKHPCWSKDGSMIFFSGNIAYSSRYDIYGIRINDSITLGPNAPRIMVSSGSGSKEYPSWGD